MASSVSRPCRTAASRVARTAASAMTSTSRAVKLGAGNGAVGQIAAGSPPAGHGSGDADGRPWSPRPGSCRSSAEKASPAMPLRPTRKAASTSLSAVLQIAQGGGAGIQRREGVDQHDLAVEPAKRAAEERPYDMGLVGIRSAAPSSPPACRRRRLEPFGQGQGREGWNSAGDPSRSPGIRKRPGGRVERA